MYIYINKSFTFLFYTILAIVFVIITNKNLFHTILIFLRKARYRDADDDIG